MAGFVIMHRDILEWEWYQSPTVSRLYFHLILRVNYTDKRWQGILVKRGQLITSNENLALELKLSIQQIRTALQKLLEGNYIKLNATSRFTLITLINYDKFQTYESIANKPITSKQQTNNKPITTTKQSKKENKVNKLTIEGRLEKFKKQVFEHTQYDFKILNIFFNYWSELNSSQTKMRKEKDDFFNIEMRLEKWVQNENHDMPKFQKQKDLSRIKSNR